jgi:N-acetylglutamate synthase-like GNAT family acetyltransferase
LIREAEASDKDAIQNLYRDLCPNAPVKVLPERIKQIRHDPNNFLFVYEEAGNILGTIFFTICLSPMFGIQPFGVVENFIVADNRRGQGIGTLLINHVFKVGRENKCFAVKLFSSSFRENAHQFFEKNGFNSSDKKAFIRYLNRCC